MRRLVCVIAAMATITVAAPFVSAQDVSAQETSGPPSYRPGLGDLMTTTIQPRHMLGLAGREKNWSYAAYELRELEEAFDRASVQWPQWQKLPIVEMIETIIRQPLFDLGQAIKTKNEKGYAEAYGRLTEACNGCHQGARRGFVVIQEPKESFFADQDFRAQP
jgi:hypothetical protein